MTIEDEFSKAHNTLRLRHDAVAALLKQGRPANDPLLRQATKALKEAADAYDKIVSQL